MAGSTKPSSVSPEPSPPTPSSFVRDCSQRLCSPYCPQWCSNYFILPPPPPDDDSSSSSSSRISPVMVALISVLAAAFLLLTYYTFSTTYCKQRRRRRQRRRPSEVGFEDFEVIDDQADDQRRRLHQLVHGSGTQQPPPAGGLDDRFIKSITVFKYRRAEGLVDSAECAVCLTEFKEEESLRLMPNCLHAFHLPCIDTWLKDHSNCPICRAPMAVDPAVVALSAARPPPQTAANVTNATTTTTTSTTTTTVSRHQSSGGSRMESVVVVVMVPEDQGRGEEHMDRGISSSDCGDPDRRRMMDQTPKRGDVDQ